MSVLENGGEIVLEELGDGIPEFREMGEDEFLYQPRLETTDLFAALNGLGDPNINMLSSGEFATNHPTFNQQGPILNIQTPSSINAPTTPFPPPQNYSLEDAELRFAAHVHTQNQGTVDPALFSSSSSSEDPEETAPSSVPSGKRARHFTEAELYPNLREQYSPTPSPAPGYHPVELKQEPMIQEYMEEAAKIQNQVRDLRVDERTIRDLLVKSAKDIKSLTLPIPQEISSAIEATLKSLLTKAENDLGIIQQIVTNYIVEPRDLFSLGEIRQDLYIHVQQLRLYHHELQYLKQSTPNAPVRGFACLVVSKQAFPKTIKQLTKCSSAGEDPVTVAFIRGAKTEVLPNGKVKASISFDDHSGKKQAFEIQNDVVELDGDNQAVFANLRFPSGTRMKPVRLQFSLDVKYADRPGSITTGVIESDSSAPFIVVTNESQWFGAAGALLKKDAFQGGRAELSWQHFANILQFHYLRATRQPTSNPQRPLSREELDYFQREKFAGKQAITAKDFDKFWEWFGKVLYKVRHQKHFCQMWVQGYVYGFLTKFEAEQLLRNEPPGAFVLRFSERAAGKVAVAYVKRGEAGAPNEIKHYLIDPHNCEGKDSVTLPEFLTPHAHFLYFLQLDTSFFSPKMSSKRRVPKMDVLRNFFLGSDSGLVGYDPELS